MNAVGLAASQLAYDNYVELQDAVNSLYKECGSWHGRVGVEFLSDMLHNCPSVLFAKRLCRGRARVVHLLLTESTATRPATGPARRTNTRAFERIESPRWISKRTTCRARRGHCTQERRAPHVARSSSRGSEPAAVRDYGTAPESAQRCSVCLWRGRRQADAAEARVRHDRAALPESTAAEASGPETGTRRAPGPPVPSLTLAGAAGEAADGDATSLKTYMEDVGRRKTQNPGFFVQEDEESPRKTQFRAPTLQKLRFP
ncbi:hypothetical protein MRX96_006510 [Rhipicephalus microplus]